jgi:stage V sporulation protein B
VLKKIAFTFYVREYLKAFLVMGASGLGGYWLFKNFLVHEHLAIRVLTSASAMSLAYILMLILFGLIKKDDLKRIPIIKNLI